MYFWIPKDIRETLDLSDNEITNPAIKLLKKLMSKNSAVLDRFKAIGIVANATELDSKLGNPQRGLLKSYNGQPILTRPQHRFYSGDGYFEVDVDAHEFNYLARKGLSGVTDHMCHMIVDFGFVVEGHSDDELPETIIGCVRLSKLDLKDAPRMQ